MPEDRHPVQRAVLALSDPEWRVSTRDLMARAGVEGPGLYAWFVDPPGAAELSQGLGVPVTTGLVYAGQTGAGASSATLRGRVGRSHARGNIRGSTFRLTLAAALAKPLRLKAVAFRRTTPDGEARLTEWIADHLEVAIYAYPDRMTLDQFETAVLAALDPPLNLAKMPPSPVRTALTAVRRPFMQRPSA